MQIKQFTFWQSYILTFQKLKKFKKGGETPCSERYLEKSVISYRPFFHLLLPFILRRKELSDMNYDDKKTQNGHKKTQPTKQLALAILTLIKNLVNVIDHIIDDNRR